LFRTLHQQLIKLTQQLSLHPCILTALWLGLVATRTDTPYPEVQADMLPTLRLLLQLQAQAGWEQLYCGHISSAWAKAINQEHPKLRKTGEQVMVMMQKIIWQFILDTWKIRNQHLHQNAMQLDLPNY